MLCFVNYALIAISHIVSLVVKTVSHSFFLLEK